MGETVLICAMLAAGAAPVPPVAPVPRVVKPDVSLIVSEECRIEGNSYRTRVLRIGYRSGKAMPTEVIWESDERDVAGLTGGEIRANRYLVAMRGAVFDIREKKLIKAERDGEVVRVDDTKVTYWIAGKSRDQGLFAFEYATGKLTRIDKLKEPRIPAGFYRSPDCLTAINWVDGELFLLRDGEKPKSLGTGFKTDLTHSLQIKHEFTKFPVLWLDNGHFLTQRGTGKLVIVDLDGKVSDVGTIEALPRDALHIGLCRDDAGSIFYSVEKKYYKVDLAKKTATPVDWVDVGHGFEMTWNSDGDENHKCRHDGKNISRCFGGPFHTASAPGFLAVRTKDFKEVVVWCAATGVWTTREFPGNTGIAGWIK